jgi:2-methylcitrate dehydratase PrpD
MTNATERLSDFAAQLKFEDLPEQVVEQTKMFIADYIAAALAGCKANADVNTAVLSLIDEMGGAEQSSVLFARKKYPVSNAAFVNALYSHGADMDDGNRKAAGHIGTHVMSAVFALSQTLSVSWEDLFVAINVGYEVFNRVAGAAQPSLYNKGFHSTSIAGSVACAAACGKLLGLDSACIYNAMSLGAIQSNGLIIIDESGQACKPINPANAARTGVISAQLAAKGINSSRNPLESKKGWFNAFSDSVDEEELLGGLGEQFTICECYLKLYPTCRHTHCGIEAAINIRNRMLEHGRVLNDVASIQVIIYPSAIKSAGSIKHPSTPEEAKFSIHYDLATALYYGKFGLSDLNCENTGAEVSELIEKIELIPDNTMENRIAGIRGAKVIVKLSDGMAEEETILIPKGEASKPFTWDDIRVKMDACAEGLEVETQGLVDTIRNLDTSKPFSIWMSWIQ